MKRIGVTANGSKPRAPEILHRLAAHARQLHLELVTCDGTDALLPGARAVSQAGFADAIDVLVAMGGDGTMLHAARLLEGRDIPLLGVNLGSLGFLTSVTDDRVEAALDALVGGGYSLSHRSTIDAVFHHGGATAGRYRALNDVVIGWGETSRVVTLGITIDGVPVGSFVCDGLIASTPTGSTGHSLSTGGPVVHPESRVILLNPICPHTLSNRPMVIPDDRRISIEVTRSSKRQILVIDGQDHHQIVQGDRLEIASSPHGVRFIHLPGYNYFDVLRQKLHWRSSNV